MDTEVYLAKISSSSRSLFERTRSGTYEPQPVMRTLGPYVVSGGWWNRTVHREYHYAETRQRLGDGRQNGRRDRFRGCRSRPAGRAVRGDGRRGRVDQPDVRRA